MIPISHCRMANNFNFVSSQTDHRMSQNKDKSALKQFLPHLGIVVFFIGLALAYCYPLLQGKVIMQSDIIQSLGMQTEIHEYADKTGTPPLWTNSMFSGMPAFQIWAVYPKVLVGHINIGILALLPHPANVIFMYLLFSYLTFLLLGFDKWKSLLGAVAYSFMSANFLYLEAGHYSKTVAMAYMPLVVGAAIVTLRGRWMFGAALFAVIFSMQLRANHVQIAYYTGMFTGLIWLAYLANAIKEKALPIFAKGTAALVLAGLLGMAVNASILWTTYEYAKDTIRGGSELSEDANNGGLDLDYALRWSYSPAETFTLLIPNFYGGSSNENIGKGSITYETLVSKGVSAKQAEGFVSNAPLYFGDQPFTGGPFYFGAVVCFLFLLGLLVTKGPLKWAVLAFVIFFVPLSWGKNFMPLTEVFFNYFPLYNKFRDVKMILVAVELAFVLIAVLGLKEILSGKIPVAELKKKLYIAAGVTGGLSLFLALFAGAFLSFEGSADAQYLQMGQIGPDLVAALKADRARLLRVDAFRSLVFILIAGAGVWAYLGDKIKPKYLVLGLTALILVDFWPVNQRFFDSTDYITQKEYDRYSAPDGIDLSIKQDTDPHYRVLNLAANTFNDAFTSYQHKSVGGYHAAKLSRYQDMIERHIGANNRAVWNMLNAKYIIIKDEKQPGGKNVIKNTDALGNAWFIDGFQMVDGAEAEISALNGFNPSSTAVVDKKYADYVQALQPAKSGSTIALTSYEPDHIVYKATVAGGEQFAVFSEIYYNSGKGWKAYIDDQPVEHIRVNYVLRGLKIPAGEHTIRFDFEPQKYYLGENISLIASIISLLLFGGAVYMEYKQSKEGRKAA